jgi:hypothetical protein
LCVVTLSSCNDEAGTEEYLHQNQTVLVDSDTSVSARYSRSSQRPKSAKTATKSRETKASERRRSSEDLQSSSSAARSTAKTPLVLRLLQEKEPTNINNQLAYSPLAQLHQSQEQETVRYHRAPQENAGGVLEYAEPKYETPTYKEIGVSNCFYIPWLPPAKFPSSLHVVLIGTVGDHKLIVFPRQVAGSLLAFLGIIRE